MIPVTEPCILAPILANELVRSNVDVTYRVVVRVGIWTNVPNRVIVHDRLSSRWSPGSKSPKRRRESSLQEEKVDRKQRPIR